jgi:ABC-type antimicrobial peptide transport system permease subunit
MLHKLLFKNQDRLQLIIAVFGSLLGVTFLVTSIHYLIKVQEFGEGADILGPNTIIVQKKVDNASTIGIKSTDFSEVEIAKIQKMEFIKDVQPVVSNNFKVMFGTKDPNVPPFSTDAFVQTIDPDFLDVKPDIWNWKKGDDFVPIIMPRDLFVMLNTFMSASGIPQVSDDVVKSINCEFKLSYGRKAEHLNCRVVGFTNQVSAILVPESFMNYGTENFSDGTPQKVTQILISGKENEFGLVEEMLDKRGLESRDSQMVIGKLKSIVGTLVIVIMSISIIAVLVSGLVLIQFMQLLMTRNAYEVRTLMRVGYHPKKIIRKFFIYFVRIFGIITAIGFVAFLLLKYLLDGVFASGGINLDTEITLTSIFALVLAYGIFALASYFTAKKGIFNEY